MGFIPARHPTHWGRIPPGGKVPRKLLPPGPFPGVHGQSPDAGDHLTDNQEGRAYYPQRNSVGLVELDAILRHHRTPGCSSTGNYRAQDRGSFPAPALGTQRDPALPCAQLTSGAGQYHGSRPQLNALQLRQETKTGMWLTVLPYTVNVTELGYQEWQYSLFFCYSVAPQTYLSTEMSSIPPSISVMIWTARRVASSPLIIASYVMGSPNSQANTSPPCTCSATHSYIQVMQCGGKSKLARKLPRNPHVAVENLEHKEYLIICYLWQIGVDSIQDMCVVNTDALSNQKNSP